VPIYCTYTEDLSIILLAAQQLNETLLRTRRFTVVESQSLVLFTTVDKKGELASLNTVTWRLLDEQNRESA
jgi:hypothetical protein